MCLPRGGSDRSGSALPLIAWIVLALAASLRSARKLRWKNASAGTLMLAGLHSHLQQLPILVGQLQFLRDPRQQATARLD